MAEREVVFRLTAMPDPQAAANLRSFGDSILREQKRIMAATGGGLISPSRARTDAEKAAAEARKLADKMVQEAKRVSDAREREINRTTQAIARATAAEERAATRAANQRVAVAAAASEREGRLVAQAQQSAADQSQAAWGQAQSRILAGQQRLAEGFDRVASGALRMGRGIAQSGLVGKENLDELLTQLIRIEAVTNIGGGGFSLLRGAESMVRGRAMINQGMAAERAATAASRGASGAGGAFRLAGSAAAMSPGGQALASGGGAAAATGGGFAATAAAGIAAVTAWAVVGKQLHELATGSAKDAGSVTYRIAEMEVKFVDWIGRMSGAFDLTGSGKVGKLEADRAGNLANKARLEALGGVRANQSNALFDARRSRAGILNIGDDSLRNMNAFHSATAERDTARVVAIGGRTANERENATQRLVALEQERAELLKEGLSISQRENESRIEGANRVIEKLREEQSERQKSIDREAGKLRTGAERFADLSPFQQRRAIELQRSATVAERLDAQGNRQGAQAIRGQFTRDDRQLLGGLGLAGTERAASQAGVEAANRSGFSRFFGAEERSKIARDQQVQQAIAVQLKDQRELKVSIERDDRQLAESIGRQVREMLDARDTVLKAQIVKEAQQQTLAVNQRSQEHFAQHSRASR